MYNVVLRSLFAENFASFAERIDFTTEVDTSKKEYPENTFTQAGRTFNKVSFLYGANGSGKTFFCKILREIQRLMEWSPLTATNNTQLLSLPQLKGIDSAIPTFAFDTAYQSKPTRLGIDILLHETNYHYEFTVQNKKITYELLTRKYKRTEKLLERTSASFKDINLRSDLKDFEAVKHVVKEEALCLPIAALLNNMLATGLVEAIQNIEVVSMTAARLQPAHKRESFSDERLEKYSRILKVADPTIRKMTVSFEEKEVARQKIDSDDFENREIVATKATVGVETEHAVYENGAETCSVPVQFFADESLGTIKLFTALPYLFDVLELGGIIFIDEIENGLHLSLVREIIHLFTERTSNPLNAQLICTSHQPLLVDGDFRRDQVWVASKDDFGQSSLQRLSNMKTSRAKINLTNKLIEGAFGCNPNQFFVDNT